MPDIRGHLLPIYLLVDESASMGSNIAELEAGLNALHAALLAEPMAAAKVRLSVIGFSDDAVLRLDLADIRTLTDLPRLVKRARTSYAAAFAELERRIPDDVSRLKRGGYQVHRPAVYFLSDGEPTDGRAWEPIHARLVDRNRTPAAPNIIACGIGDADAEIILSVATEPRYAFIAASSTDVGASVAKFCVELTKSVVKSGRTLATGSPELVMNPPDGFRLVIDVV